MVIKLLNLHCTFTQVLQATSAVLVPIQVVTPSQTCSFTYGTPTYPDLYLSDTLNTHLSLTLYRNVEHLTSDGFPAVI